MYCHECGQEFIIDGFDVSYHVFEGGETDWDTDADHVAFALVDPGPQLIAWINSQD
jgi:hypothetical protein